MSTAADIWEVMAEEISAHPRDRFEMFRDRDHNIDAFITYGSTGVAEIVAAAKVDPDRTRVVGAEAELAAACTRYNVTGEEVHNSRVRHTAVIAARVSIATRLAAAGWTGVDIGEFLFRKRTNVSHMLHGGRGKGVLPASRIAKDLATRRLPHGPRVKRGGNSGFRGYRRLDQATHVLRRLHTIGEEQLMPRIVEKYFPELTLRDVYDAALGRADAPLTLDEAREAEARGEGTLKFVGGVPRWLPSQAPPPQMLPGRPPEPEAATPDQSPLRHAG